MFELFMKTIFWMIVIVILITSLVDSDNSKDM